MNPSDQQRVALVTGASSGIGAAIGAALVRAGYRAWGTTRHAGRSLPVGVEPLVMDVTNDDSVANAIESVLRRDGRIDAVVNNAGVTLLGAVEETTAKEAMAVFDTNVLGVHRVTRAALPALRLSRGHCIVVGSIAGFLPKPFEAFYSASKHALEAWAEVLSYEVGPLGVRVTLIEPGFVRTALATHAAATATELEVYRRARKAASSVFEADVAAGTDASIVAGEVVRVLESARPPLRRLIGADAFQMRTIRSLLPAPLFRWGLRRRFHLQGRASP
jgi:NAD(P)-dependent dehydrogenase (short-subunit alcohol dehydrogenase family)